jgi:outer membrane protein assembly factor BamB
MVLTRHGYMVCIRAHVGTIRWTIKIPGTAGSISRPEPFAPHEFMLLVSGHLLILNSRTGAIIHDKSLDMAPGTNPIMDENTILIGSLHNHMYALSANWPPRQLWFQLDRGDSFITDPVVVDGEVVFASRNGIIYARDLADGTGGWKRRVGGHVLASPAAAHGIVYFPCMDSNVYAVNADTGISPWITRLPGELEFSPLILKRHLLIPTGGVGLFSLSMKTGLKQWGPVPNGFSIVGRKGGEIYVATTHGTVAVVNLATGHVLKSMAYDEPSIFMHNGKTSNIFMASVSGDVEELKPLRRQ